MFFYGLARFSVVRCGSARFSVVRCGSARFGGLPPQTNGMPVILQKRRLLYEAASAFYELMLFSVLYKTLCHHSFCNFFETFDVRTFYEGVLTILLFGCFLTSLMNVNHNLVKLIINILVLIYRMTCILTHFDAGCSYAACVCSLGRSNDDAVVL